MIFPVFNIGNSALHVGLYTLVLKDLLPSGISGDKTAKTPAQKANTRALPGGWTDLHHEEDPD